MWRYSQHRRMVDAAEVDVGAVAAMEEEVETVTAVAMLPVVTTASV